VDRHEFMADVSLDEKTKLLPEESLQEYVKDGQPAQPGDPAGRVVDGKFQRRLRDYRELFSFYRADRILFADTYESLVRDAQYVKEAADDAQRHLHFAEQEVAALKSEKAVALKEEKAVVDHRIVLERRVAGLRQVIAEKIKENLGIAAEIKRVQEEAVRRIDQRTHTMAQAALRLN